MHTDTPVHTNTRLVDDTLFVTDAPLALRGAECARCRTVTFPVQSACPRCGSEEMNDIPLPRTGTLWSFTIQGFEPKRPYRGMEPFEPYGVAYVDLGPVIVETRLTVNDPAALHIGDPMHLSFVPVFRDDDGTTVLTFAFGPGDAA
jgi:uncharacterized OB-fold protein